MLQDEGDIRLIGRYLRSAASEAEDLLLVYFVGHGLVSGRRHELYLGLPDSEWAEPEWNSLEYDKLRSSVLDSPAATKIIILDCCFSGRALSGSWQPRLPRWSVRSRSMVPTCLLPPHVIRVALITCLARTTPRFPGVFLICSAMACPAGRSSSRSITCTGSL